ncbi:hypothetical protein NDU88_006086 [Pleurodeles waltl]|uniref:Uncharacterized protein n=1 Tax=Pleurodeles waltl TaxID=8319 RepID=A0AAV7NYD1_PLEWA|nr:hypothetical protein NDU88_006086 [Pleurodeles waltl]
MSRTDTKQAKLTNEDIKCIRYTKGKRSYGATMNPQMEEDAGELDLREMLLDVKTSLKTIDGNLDLLTAHLDQVKQRVDTHEFRLDCLET